MFMPLEMLNKRNGGLILSFLAARKGGNCFEIICP